VVIGHVAVHVSSRRFQNDGALIEEQSLPVNW
jgi:hypothetical protein